jgi:hypothetical protein
VFSLLAINGYDMSSRLAEISLDLTKKQEEKEKGLVQCASWLV